MNKEIFDSIKELITNLGSFGQLAWETAIKQQYIDFWMSTCLLLIAVVVSCVIIKAIKNPLLQYFSESWYNHSIKTSLAVWCVVTLCSIDGILAIMFICNLRHVLNPEYGAMHMLINLA